MRKKEIQEVARKYPEISSISIDVKKYPKYISGGPPCQHIYIARSKNTRKCLVFFHLVK